jgi:hypothetical protein
MKKNDIDLEGPSSIPVWWTSLPPEHWKKEMVAGTKENPMHFVKARLWFEARGLLGREAYRLDEVCPPGTYEQVWSWLERLPLVPQGGDQ